MFLKRKRWLDYTSEELALMKQMVEASSGDTPFSPEYAASYIGKSPSTLQHMRCHQSNGITYSKIGGHVVYRRKHLDEYLNRCEKSCTSSKINA